MFGFRCLAFGFRLADFGCIITKVFHWIMPPTATVDGMSGFPPVIIFFVWQVTKIRNMKKNSVRVGDELSTVSQESQNKCFKQYS